MTSFVGLSTATREALEAKGRKLKGPLVITRQSHHTEADRQTVGRRWRVQELTNTRLCFAIIPCSAQGEPPEKHHPGVRRCLLGPLRRAARRRCRGSRQSRAGHRAPERGEAGRWTASAV